MTRDDRSYLLTTSDAALAAAVQPDTLHQWAHRGYLTRHGTRRNALWDIREIAQVATTRGRRKRIA